MSAIRALRPEPSPALHDRAMDNLRFIRETMERAASFTAVPGWGGVAIGVTALVTAGVAARQPWPLGWGQAWLFEAVVAGVIGFATLLRKARRSDTSLFRGPGRRFTLGFLPAVLVGGVLTLALWQAGDFPVIPGLWLLLYGVAVLSAGAFSVRIVPLLGLCFVAMGICALFTPAAWRDFWMAAGFGGLHVVFGLIIAWRHGG